MLRIFRVAGLRVLLLTAGPSDGIEDKEHVGLAFDSAERREIAEDLSILIGNIVLFQEALVVEAIAPYVAGLGPFCGDSDRARHLVFVPFSSANAAKIRHRCNCHYLQL